MRQGAGVFKLDLPGVNADASNDLTPTMRRLLAELFEDLEQLEKRIAEVTREIEALAARDEAARRLMTVPGIGSLAGTALLASAGNRQQFRKTRDMAAWLGLVPQQHSTGGRTQMLGLSKRGNRYVRRLLIHGARSCVVHLDWTRNRLGSGSRRCNRACTSTRSP
jgi:transposase